MLPGQLLFATPNCHHCGMLSDSNSSYAGDGFWILFCSFCREKMDGDVDEIASDLLTDPKILEAHKEYPEDQRQEMILTLAEDMYFFGQNEED